MLSLHLFVFNKVVALNSPNGADVPLRTYSTNKVYLLLGLLLRDQGRDFDSWPGPPLHRKICLISKLTPVVHGAHVVLIVNSIVRADIRKAWYDRCYVDIVQLSSVNLPLHISPHIRPIIPMFHWLCCKYMQFGTRCLSKMSCPVFDVLDWLLSRFLVMVILSGIAPLSLHGRSSSRWKLQGTPYSCLHTVPVPFRVSLMFRIERWLHHFIHQCEISWQYR